MRNLGQRFSKSNVFNVYYASERQLALRRLREAMQAGVHLTPSEQRIVDGLESWFNQVDWEWAYATKNVAYAYTNLNTGVNLLFLLCVPHEGSSGGDAGSPGTHLSAVDFE